MRFRVFFLSLFFCFKGTFTSGQLLDLKFEHITSENGLPQNTIHGIAKDKVGFMWFGTWGGLCRYDGYSFKVYRHDPKNNRSLNNNRVHNVIKDRFANIWILTFQADELCRYNYETDDFDRIPINKVSQKFYKLLERRAHYETVNYSYKFYRWNLEPYTNSLVQSNVRSGESMYYTSNAANKWTINDPYVTDIYKDDQNILWVGTYSNGVNKANLEAKPFQYYYHDPSNPNSLIDNNVRAICEDSSGNLWVGTREKGISIISKNKIQHLKSEPGNDNSLQSDQIKTIFCDSRGIMWIGNKKGLDSYDRASKTFQHWTGEGLANTTVFGIVEDKYKNLWFASWKGLYQYIPSKGKMIHHDPSRTLKSTHARTLVVDRSGRIWVGTEGGGLTLLKYEEKNNRLSVVRHFRHSDTDPGTISDDRVNALFEDKSGHIWVGTGNGLDRLNSASLDVMHLPESTGLAEATVSGIIEDNRGYVWISHKRGISQVNNKTFGVRNYTLQDGLQSNEFSDEACYKSKFSNLLFFGGNNGFNSFNPDSIKADLSLPRTVITQLQVLNNNVDINKEVNGRILLTKPLHLLKELVLTYSDKSFSLEFAALHYSNPNSNRYAYKLEGFDKRWIYTKASRRIATYANLSPGTYKFMVKSSNADGVWNPEPAVLNIVVRPPFWASSYAYVFYFFLAGAVFWAYHYYSVRYTRLKSKLAYELIIREKENELHQQKLQFFTNISHEIKTPLTLILAPIEKLSTLYVDNSFVSEQIRTMKNNGQRLLRLINQLLDFRRLETGNAELNLKRNDLVKFTQSVFDAFEPAIREKGIRAAYKHQQEVFYGNYDEDKLEKVLSNLLSNAIKFTPKDGYIGVRLDKGVYNDHECAVLEVANSGKGIPEAERSAIFKPFVQGGAAQEGGTGLGLAYSKGLVELHGGTISLSCQSLSEGSYETKFRVELPVGEMEQESAAPVAAEEGANELHRVQTAFTEVIANSNPERNPVIINGKVPLILLVEDNVDLRRYLKEHFENSYHLLEAGGGREALSIASENLPDLIISDIMMPEMDGLEFCRKIKTNVKTAHIPLILLTAKAPLENQIEGLETGADDYIIKPFNLDYLSTKVKNLILQRNKLKEKYRKEISIQPTNNIPVSADEKLLNKVLKYIEDHIAESELNIDAISSEVGLSRAQLYRRLKAITGLSVAELIKEIKLKRAKQLLKDGKFNINEITYMIGFSDADYFRKCFKAEFGVAPSKYYKSRHEGEE